MRCWVCAAMHAHLLLWNKSRERASRPPDSAERPAASRAPAPNSSERGRAGARARGRARASTHMCAHAREPQTLDQVSHIGKFGTEAGDGASAVFGSRSRGAHFLARRFLMVADLGELHCALGVRLTRIPKTLDYRVGCRLQRHAPDQVTHRKA